MRSYVVQRGDSPAKIAIAFAGCPKCAADLVVANPRKPSRIYPNGFRTFEALQVGETIALPDKWFDGTLDRLPRSYYDALPALPPAHGLGGPPPAPQVTSPSQVGLTQNSDGSYSYDADGAIGGASSAAESTIAQMAAGTSVGQAFTAGAAIGASVGAALGTAAAALGATGAGIVLIPVAVVLFGAVYALTVGLDPAHGGAGCCGNGNCGSGTFAWFGGEDPEYTQWTAPYPGTFEDFFYGIAQADYNVLTGDGGQPGCSINWAALPIRYAYLLAVAVAAWNNTHSIAGTPQVDALGQVVAGTGGKRTIGRIANPSTRANAPYDDPIQVAMNGIAIGANERFDPTTGALIQAPTCDGSYGCAKGPDVVPADTTITVIVNNGPSLPAGAILIPPVGPVGGAGAVQAPAPTSSSSTGSTVVKGVAVVAVASAASLGIYAAATKQSIGGAARGLYRKIRG